MKEPLGRTILTCLFMVSFACSPDPQSRDFSLVELTISDIHGNLRAGRITCRELVEGYLARIEAYDKPTDLNSIVVVNSRAVERAQELDGEFQSTGKLRPCHCVPLIVKDNYDTHDLQTAAGSAALAGSLPPDDAYQVRVLREAGAIVLAKSNMAEWAFSPYQTVSSIAGITRNPYDPSRVPAGSSGGTAAAVAANLGAVGLGTDTGNSIRGPSSHTALVGIRSTIGVTSRDGIVPLYLRNDIGGPMARTVEDAVRIFSIIAGYDPADPVTESSRGQIAENYLQYLDPEGLKGARLGVLRAVSNTETADPEMVALFDRAIEDLKGLGAEVVDPLEISGFDEYKESLWCDVFQYDVDAYFASQPASSDGDFGQLEPNREGEMKFSIAVMFIWFTQACTSLSAQVPDTVFLEELTWTEARDAIRSGKTTVIIPTGGTEQNGPHMVLGKHNFIVKHTAGQIARRIGDTLVAPVMAYVPEGELDPPTGHMRFSGTITLPNEYFMKVVEYAARSFKVHGFTDVVLIGDSGGNQEGMKAVTELLNQEWADSETRVHFVSDYYSGNGFREWLQSQGETQEDIGSHAGIGDTSQLMKLYPELVRSSKRAKSLTIQPTGVVGNPTHASASYGAKILELKIEAAVAQARALMASSRN